MIKSTCVTIPEKPVLCKRFHASVQRIQWIYLLCLTQLTFTYLKSTVERPEQCVKYVQS